MWVQFGDFLALSVPDMHCPVLAAWQNELGVGSEGALDDWGLVEEGGEFVEFVTFEGVKHDDAVIRGGQEHEFSIVWEFHDLNFVVVFAPVCEGASLAVFGAVETYPDYLFVLLLYGPGYSKGDTSGVKIGDGVGGHGLWVDVEFEVTFWMCYVLPWELELIFQIRMVLSLLVVRKVSSLGFITKLVIVSRCPLNIFMTLFSWMDQYNIRWFFLVATKIAELLWVWLSCSISWVFMKSLR